MLSGRMQRWLRQLLIGRIAEQAEEDRRIARQEYVRRLEYEQQLAVDTAEHADMTSKLKTLDERLAEIERSVNATEAEVQMYARTLQLQGKEMRQ